MIPAALFLENYLDDFKRYLSSYNVDQDKCLLPVGTALNYSLFENELKQAFDTLKEKCRSHPELFGIEEGANESDAKVLLDALYEEGKDRLSIKPTNHHAEQRLWRQRLHGM